MRGVQRDRNDRYTMTKGRGMPVRRMLGGLTLVFASALIIAACDVDEVDEVAEPDPPEEAPEEPEEAPDEPEEAPDEPDPVQLRTAVAFPQGSLLDEGWWRFVEILEEEAPWIEIDHRGGPEVIDELELVDAIRTGVLDMAPVPNAYYAHELPLIVAMDAAPLTPEEEREAGTFDYWQAVHEERLDLVYLGNTLAASDFMLYLGSPIEEADLSGMSIRVNPVYAGLVAALGGEGVSMPFGDVYTAMERGVVDGFGWLAYGLDDLGVADVVEYAVKPTFYQSRTNLLINPDVWNGLDDATREAVQRSIQRLEAELPGMYERIMAQADEEREAAGIETITLPPDEAEHFLETAYEAKWEQVLEMAPEAEELLQWYQR